MDAPRICPDCKGVGGIYTMDGSACDFCPEEGCIGPLDRPDCPCLLYKCCTCGGRGIINSPHSSVIFVHPLDAHRC